MEASNIIDLDMVHEVAMETTARLNALRVLVGYGSHRTYPDTKVARIHHFFNKTVSAPEKCCEDSQQTMLDIVAFLTQDTAPSTGFKIKALQMAMQNFESLIQAYSSKEKEDHLTTLKIMECLDVSALLNLANEYLKLADPNKMLPSSKSSPQPQRPR